MKIVKWIILFFALVAFVSCIPTAAEREARQHKSRLVTFNRTDDSFIWITLLARNSAQVLENLGSALEAEEFTPRTVVEEEPEEITIEDPPSLPAETEAVDGTLVDASSTSGPDGATADSSDGGGGDGGGD